MQQHTCHSPLVSVLLPVRNGMPFLVEAIDSILHQTLDDLEVLVVDDGSVDTTEEFIRSLTDSRVKYIKGDGEGLVSALNTGIACCRGTFVARMDADDISEKDRLERQAEAFSRDNQIGVVCSDVTLIDLEGRSLGVARHKMPGRERVKDGLRGLKNIKPIIHPSVMMRAEVLRRVNGYRYYSCAEDRDLWLRLMDECEFRRINLPLLRYRLTPFGVSRAKAETQRGNALLAILNYELKREVGIDLYADHYQIWLDLQRMLLSYSGGQSEAVKSFERTRNLVRERRYVSVAAELLRQTCRPSFSFLPLTRTRAERVHLIRTLELAKALLNVMRESPRMYSYASGSEVI